MLARPSLSVLFMLAPVVLVHLVCVSAVLCICAGGTLSFYLSVAVFFVFGPVILGHPVYFCWLCMRAEGFTFAVLVGIPCP